MDNSVIEVKNLSKKYNIVHLELMGFTTLRDKLANIFAHPIKVFKSFKSNKKEEFWALRDINLSVKAGEMIGVIGGNGAGKSTLLKVLSRITPPSHGQATIRGRVASLLEVGTGFHPELTGRENIFLNGAILGMPKADIIKRFDEIVEFSGVAKFLDTPVKRYSSGMYVRLAFAVAAHMESDILFVDEVLAVGDAEFQKKCIGKMGEMVEDKSKTILFVSHNLATIKSLCPRSILLDRGRIVTDGPTTEVIEKYLTNRSESLSKETAFTDGIDKPISLKSLKLSNSTGQISKIFQCDQDIFINFSCQVKESLPSFHGYLEIKDGSGNMVMESVSHDNSPDPITNLAPGEHDFRLIIPSRTLAPGRYSLSLSFLSSNQSGMGSMGSLCEFEMKDDSTIRGNDRNGWFSTILKWQEINK